MSETLHTPWTAVVTGASSGIGAATAVALARRGRALVLVGRNRERLEAVARDVEARGSNAVTCVADLSKAGDVHAVASTAGTTVDLLVHGAGIVALDRIEVLREEDVERQFRVNALAPTMLTQACLPALRSARGLVVFVNSGAGLRANPSWAGYAASKFAVRAIADALRAEESASGVRVTTVYPGRTATPMQEEVRRQEDAPYDPTVYVQPDEIASLVAAVAELPPTTTVPDLTVRPV